MLDPVPDPIDRAFVRLPEGLIHVRQAAGQAGRRPLVLLHASPGSSLGLTGLMRALHACPGSPPLIAPDTPGNGDSAAPSVEEPDIPWFTDALVRLLDALGLDRVDLYGSHTGARTACEAAAAHPDRIASVIFDGIGEYDDAMRALLIDRYAPAMDYDDYGRQFVWAFNFVRDQALHFPHFLRDPEHRLMTRPVPSAAELHAATVEVLKGLTSYHKAYRAAFAYVASARMGDIEARTLFLSAENELPRLRAQIEGYAAQVRDASISTVSRDLADKAAVIRAFLDARD